VGPLRYDNGIGGFTDDGREYVVYGVPPAPWCNVLANSELGTLVSEGGGGFTWSQNSQRHRLTPWSNDPVRDPAGEAIYLRDVSGLVWRATDGTVRHSAHCSSFSGLTRGLRHELTVFVAVDEPVKLSRLSLENATPQPKRLSVYGYVEWVLGASRETSRLTTVTLWDGTLETALAQNRHEGMPVRCAFFRCTAPVESATGDRAEFFAGSSTRAHPRGVDGRLSGTWGATADPCAALQVEVEIPAKSTVVLAFVLGDAPDEAKARTLATEWSTRQRIDEELARSQASSEEILGAIQIETPDRALDFLFNRWLLHQVLACRVWGRSAFYQSGGAFGFRDQLQDVMALLYSRPDLARSHILRAAARQFEEGDVQHWWHPESGMGVRTRCADDMLWLPFVTLEYVRVTGDASILDASAPFLSDRPVPADHADLFGTPHSTDQTASLYEHCSRAIDAGLTHGRHGLPLMRGGDWNDGMDRVGAGQTGESVWLGWFLSGLLRDFSALAAARGDTGLSTRLQAAAVDIAEAIERLAWDGAWYRRAFFDDGSPLGSQQNIECRIDSIAQSWSVISGMGDPRRARTAMDSAEAQLALAEPPMILLLTPPFDGHGPDPGYIKTYPPGIRENGGQYTHGALWSVLAFAMLGEGDRAYRLMTKLNPVYQASHPPHVRRYAVEPYVVAADVYSAPEHRGHGGWTWYTGAAGWMYRVVLEGLLGVRVDGSVISIRPCVPAAWKQYFIRLRRGRTTYRIRVEPGPDLRVHVDGQRVADGRIVMTDDGGSHDVQVSSAQLDDRLAV